MAVMSTADSSRPQFHITPPQGRLNDPNGVFLDPQDRNIIHVFYQHDPGFPHAPKRTGWAHTAAALSGPDALRWRHFPDALYPDAEYDSHGCYSGGAVTDAAGDVKLFYTGNRKTIDPSSGEQIRHATQNMVHADAVSDDYMGGVYRKDVANPLIPAPHAGYTAHYRDPMITVDPETESGWRMVLGAQRDDETGAVVLYRSTDLYQWEWGGELQFDTATAIPGRAPDLVPGGYMWECPNLIAMRDQVTGEILDLLIVCPQGLAATTDSAGTTHYANSDQCGYLVGSVAGTTMKIHSGFSELDNGHHFYAPQIIGETFADDRHVVADNAILIGWLGLPGQDDMPSLDSEGWVHCLSTPRRLSIHDGKLRQQLILPTADNAVPVENQQNKNIPKVSAGNAWWARLCPNGQNVTWTLVDSNGGSGLEIRVESGESAAIAITGDIGLRRLAINVDELLVYVDGCVVEVEVNGGDACFSTVVFPPNGERWVTFHKECD